MKTGRTLGTLAAEVKRQSDAKRDFLADTSNLEMNTDGALVIPAHGTFPLTNHAQGQVADHLQIPRTYYQRMATQAPALLSQNVNTWMRHQPEVRMVRTLDGEARAWLSNGYRRLDYADLMGALVPALADQQAQVQSCEITETRLYLKAVTATMEAKVRGDAVRAGVGVWGSEVGDGAVVVAGLLWVLACANGAIVEQVVRQVHLGKRQKLNGFADEQAQEYASSRTQVLEDSAFWSRAQDGIRHVLSAEYFQHLVSRANEAADLKLEHPRHVVAVLAKRQGLQQQQADAVLDALMAAGDTSAWGLSNAITLASQQVDDYEQATAMERLGGQVITMAPQDWSAIAAEAGRLAA